MKPYVVYAGIALCAGCALKSTCNDQETTKASLPEGPQQSCYALAMIGMDFVINSRLGVVPEKAVELARITTPHNENVYDETMLNIMLEAYLWPDSPGSYATKVLDDCAERQNRRDSLKLNPKACR